MDRQESHQNAVIFIGPDKAGSTWVHAFAARHPGLCVAKSKELHFFDGPSYRRGLKWYYAQFSGEPCACLVEVCHDYLFSAQSARRMRQVFGQSVRVVCIARDPVPRAVSSYLFMRRQGRTLLSFGDALRQIEELTDHSRYWKHLQPFIRELGRDFVFLMDFDLLGRNPQEFADQISRICGVQAIDLPKDLLSPQLPAGASRSPLLTRYGRGILRGLRSLGMHALATRVKSSSLVSSLFLRQLRDGERVSPTETEVETLRAALLDDTRRLDASFGLNFESKWFDATGHTSK